MHRPLRSFTEGGGPVVGGLDERSLECVILGIICFLLLRLSVCGQQTQVADQPSLLQHVEATSKREKSPSLIQRIAQNPNIQFHVRRPKTKSLSLFINLTIKSRA
ncbi:hypothetical protein CDAR_440061 [Caerostris darwini]|uniref:Uncharacterized protein n=1 Tax=Caerostris darwini TaxID=1538125 RepID=A0AAV4RMG3_9ARAC|nr:hypothetical protein CDAR_440061 [Caerostris darwini]